MPQYKYFCPVQGCKSVRNDIWHMMSECDHPSEQLIKETTCKKHKIRMQRQIFEPVLQGAVGGTFPKESELLAEKQKQRKIRSKAHFVNDVMNKVSDRDSRRYFKKKYRGVKPPDHEKM